MDDEGARFIEPVLRGRHMQKREDKKDPPICTRSVSLWINHQDFIVDGNNTVNFFVMHVKNLLENDVAIGNTTLVSKSTRM